MEVFCKGPLLETLQKRTVCSPDSKDFVDCPLSVEPSFVLDRFKFLGEQAMSDATLQHFFSSNFDSPGSDLQVCIPADYDDGATGSVFKKIKDARMRSWSLSLHQIWKDLARRTSHNVLLHPERHTLLWQPNVIVVPGGRFRESYYWDSYWIIRGTVRQMNNFTFEPFQVSLLVG
jgi:alpha,alpha-trehalase